MTPRNSLLSLCCQSLPHLTLATTDLFAGPLVSRHSFETHFTYNLFLLVFFFFCSKCKSACYCPSMPSSHRVKFCPLSVRQSMRMVNRKEGRNLLQRLPFSSLLCVWRIILVLQTHFCVLGDAESFNTGGNGAQLVRGRVCLTLMPLQSVGILQVRKEPTCSSTTCPRSSETRTCCRCLCPSETSCLPRFL